MRLPSQVDEFVRSLHRMKKDTKAEGLILLGDVKHKVPGISYQEMQEVPEFLEQINFKQIVLIKGNHDAEIEKLIHTKLKNKVKVKKSFKIGDFIFTHGHQHIRTKAKTIVIGHNQPGILFRDAVRATYTEPCWVRGPLTGRYTGKELIMVPAFNDLRGHTVVNRDELLGPIAKHLDKKEAHVFLLDSTDVGTIEALREREDRPCCENGRRGRKTSAKSHPGGRHKSHMP